jgi:hypothetical protein
MQDQEHVLDISKREGAEHDWKEEEKINHGTYLFVSLRDGRSS